MAFLFRGQANDITGLNFFILLAGTPFDAFEVGFRILNINAGLPGTQVFPVVDGTYEDVTSAPGRFAVGSYFAYDNTNAVGWTPEATAELGSYRIEWRWKDTAGSSYQTAVEDFTVVAASIGGTTPAYIDAAYVRSTFGLSANPPSDAQITASILIWQTAIERLTRSFFLPKTMTVELDGTNSRTLFFGVPIISVASIEINLNQDGEGRTLQSNEYRVYSNQSYPDNKNNPHIKLVDKYQGGRDIYTDDWDDQRFVFRSGEQNQRITCTLGCVDESGNTPELIKYALGKLVVEKLSSAGASGVSPYYLPPIVAGALQSETTDGHSISYQEIMMGKVSSGWSGITRDREIMDIIKMFKAPIGIQTQIDRSYSY